MHFQTISGAGKRVDAGAVSPAPPARMTTSH
jgi:hypothetical protein